MLAKASKSIASTMYSKSVPSFTSTITVPQPFILVVIAYECTKTIRDGVVTSCAKTYMQHLKENNGKCKRGFMKSLR